MALIDSVGMSIRESIPLLVDKLKQYGLRERIIVMSAGKLITPSGITTHNPKLQRSLHPATKAMRVASDAGNMVKEVEGIAHSCGVKNPRALNCSHARIVMGDGTTKGMEELYPEPELMNKYAHSD